MNETTVRAMAQANPVKNLTAAWTADVQAARATIDTLNLLLRRLDKTAATLEEGHDLQLAVLDLGPAGNAFAAARRDLEKQQPAGFSLPKPS